MKRAGWLVSIRAYTAAMPGDRDNDTRAFVAHVDALAERLRPRRRPRDVREPACSPRELRVLNALGLRGRTSMSHLALILEVPLSTATRTVQKLVAKGLVERKQTTRDRRIVEVGFGRRGKRINRFVADSRYAEAQAMLDTLGAREREVLLRQLAAMVATRGAAGEER